MLPKDLFKDGFQKNGETIEIDSLDNIRNLIRDHLGKQKTINTQTSSYGLKHIIENKILEGYISNGELIASMILEGYEYKKGMKTPLNAYFNLSQGSIEPFLYKPS